MGQHKIIEQIWRGDISEESASVMTPLSDLLSSLMKLPVVTLACNGQECRPYALLEATPVLEGASLGDVLSEELSIDVPYGALVLMQPKEFSRNQDYSGHKLGEILGQIILDMSEGGQCGTEWVGNQSASEKSRVGFVSSLSSTKEFSHPSASRLQ